DAGNLSGQTDRRYGAYDVPAADAPAAMRGYLQWELDLVAQIERVGGAGFAVRDFGTGTAQRSHDALARIAAGAARQFNPKESV
ncbi:hypothetical protein G3N92_34240, partial [Burkholderia sp. Ac-20379]|nr:hypothetical protein [Burkholderia sp. Ac-20379]